MDEERFYPREKKYLLSVIGDICELQNGRSVTSDSARGLVTFTTKMYGFEYVYRFTVTPVDGGCRVLLEMESNASEDMVFKAFALMESLMAKRSGGNCTCGEKLEQQ